ncbi:hypothetical protein DQW77_10960 [Roseovarius sp. TE539]|uniref:hypothetical protein n=1 Tax=Roseovarius sp. TE539 TaxID=2249812 RepID=UPI000DDCC873|nr:hypothetical protein [Roseovarius sp. TE539]RBI72275.1 hypothetical protein DQW77_10960 [Roseovarius sp. TE539]
MRALSFLAALGGLVSILMIALVALAAPTPGLADTWDAHSDLVEVTDGDVATAEHAAHEDMHDGSCHPDPSCSPAAILMTRPIFGAHGFRAVRQPLAKTATAGRNAPVDLPPPRARALPRPNILNDTQT